MSADKDYQFLKSGSDNTARSIAQFADGSDEKTKALIDMLQAANKQLELELSNTRVLARNLVGVLSKLAKAKKKPLPGMKISEQEYWAKALSQWKDQLLTNINKKTVKDLSDEVANNYSKIKEMIAALSIELPSIVADDLDARFDALVYSLMNEKVDLNVNPSDK